MNLNQVMYLEQYVEGTYFLPTELQRVLHLVKSIDDRSAELSDSLQATTQQLLGLPPQYHQAHGPSEHYTQLMQKLEAGQKQLTQFAEERTHLAQQAYDLIEMHALDLERTMENFEADLRAGGVMDADLGLDQSIGYHEVYSPSSLTQLEAQLKQRTPPPDDILGLPTPGVAITPLPLALTPAPTATTKPYVTDGIPGKSSGVGLGTPQTAVAATLGSPPPAPPSGSVTSPPTTVTTLTIKRTASASSGGHKISLPLPLKKARAEDASTPGGGPPSASTPTPPAVSVPGHQSTIMGTSTPLPAMAAPPPPPVLAPPPPPPLHVAPPPPIPASSAEKGNKKDKKSWGVAAPIPAVPHSSMGDHTDYIEQAPPIGFLSAPPPHLKPSAPRIQVPGEMLSNGHVTPALRGRHAELYWPDEEAGTSGWYLIEIQEVDVAHKKAKIVYYTGEIEELNLPDIVRDRHMSLLPRS